MPKSKSKPNKAKRSKLDWNNIDPNNPALQELFARHGRGNSSDRDRSQYEFWLCLVFQSDDQMQEFLEAIPEVPVLYNAYVDGYILAKKLGIKISPCPYSPIQAIIDKRMNDLLLTDKRLKEAKPLPPPERLVSGKSSKSRKGVIDYGSEEEGQESPVEGSVVRKKVRHK